MEKTSNYRIVLLGKTGSGKSATGNTILGRTCFKEFFTSVSLTKKCDAKSAEVDGQNITVIDTPGLYDTSTEIRELKMQIAKLFDYSGDGIHAILLVIKLCTRFTEEDQQTVKWIKDNYGEEASKNTIVLFTNGDELEYNHITIEEYLDQGEKLNELVQQCRGRYHVFKNRDNDRTQVIELLGKIKRMMQENNYELYTKEKYKITQRYLVVGGLIGAGLAGATAIGAGAATATVITAAVVGGTVGAGVVGAVGAGVAIYEASKYLKKKYKDA